MGVVATLDADFGGFEPADYLAEYYAGIGEENDALLGFLARAYASLPVGASLVEVGGGPTVYQLVAAAGRGAAITFAEPVPANRQAVKAWVAAQPGAFDWRPFVRRALEHEGVVDPPGSAVNERERQLRASLRHFRTCDVLSPAPLGALSPQFDAVGSHFVTESITADRSAWKWGLANLVGLLRPGGRLVLSSLEGATSWRAGDRTFPAVPLTADDVVGALEDLGVRVDLVERIDAETGDATSPTHQGYLGMVFAAGWRC